jgi:hypothetical protein
LVITVISALGVTDIRNNMTRADMEVFIGGPFEMLLLFASDSYGHIRFPFEIVQVLRIRGVPPPDSTFNPMVQRLFGPQLNSAAHPESFERFKNPGPVGNWVVLSGDDKI